MIENVLGAILGSFVLFVVFFVAELCVGLWIKHGIPARKRWRR